MKISGSDPSQINRTKYAVPTNHTRGLRLNSSWLRYVIMGKKGKKTQTSKPKKLTPKDIGKRLDVLAKNLEEETKGADLFAPLPPTDDCAICLVPHSRRKPETRYMPCCGNEVCWACYMENKESINKQNEEKSAGKKLAFTCPFCREPVLTAVTEVSRQLQARCLQNDRNALRLMGGRYRRGECGKPKDELKALDYYIRAVELDSPAACSNIAEIYREGSGVSVHKERSALFERVGALRGDILARYNIGCIEYHDLGNHEIAIRHWKISAEAGYQRSLNALRNIFNADGKRPGKEFISKEYLDFAYRACHDSQMEVKTEEREKHKV